MLYNYICYTIECITNTHRVATDQYRPYHLKWNKKKETKKALKNMDRILQICDTVIAIMYYFPWNRQMGCPGSP